MTANGAIQKQKQKQGIHVNYPAVPPLRKSGHTGPVADLGGILGAGEEPVGSEDWIAVTEQPYTQHEMDGRMDG